MKAIFSVSELRAIVEAAFYAEKNGEAWDWSKYCLSSTVGSTGYDKYFEYLSDREQSFFEDCMDVALNDVRDVLEMIDDAAPETMERLNMGINGWIEAAFDEFLR